MQHGGRAHLHAAGAQGEEFGRVAPVADAADAGNGQAARLRIAGDFRHHVQGDGLDGGPAIAAVRAGAAHDGQGHHAVQVQRGDRVDGVDQRDGVRAARLGRARRHAHVRDVGRELDDDGQFAVLLAPGGDHLHILGHLAHGRAHAPLRHAVRAAEIEFDAVRPRRLDLGQDVGPVVLFAGQHQRDDHGTVGPVLFHLRDFAQVDLQRAVGDQFDVIEADHFAVLAVQGGIARRDVDGRRVFTERLPHDAAPPRLEGAHHVIGLVGRRCGRQPEGIRRLDAAKFDAEISHYAASTLERRS